MVVSYLPSPILASLDRSTTNPKICFIDHPFDASELHQNKLRDLIPLSKHYNPPKTHVSSRSIQNQLLISFRNNQTTIHPFRSTGEFGLMTRFETPKAMPFLKPKKTVIITGASSGLGLAAAKSLAEQGWQVP